MSYVLNKAASLQEEGRLAEPRSLAQLRLVYIAYYGTESGLYINSAAPFLRLKSAKKVTICSVRGGGFQPEGRTFYTEDLDLQRACVQGSCIVRFLACFKNLKRFRYRCGDDTVGDDEFSPRDFGVAIRSLSRSLEEVIINDNEFKFKSLMGDEPSIPFGSLKDCEKIRKIDCTSTMLLGGSDRSLSLVEVIPKSLRKLLLFDCGGDRELRYLRELLLEKEELNLELQYVQFDYGKGSWDKDEAEVLRKHCEAAGITLLISSRLSSNRWARD